MMKRKTKKPLNEIIVRNGSKYAVNSISSDRKYLNVRRILGNEVSRRTTRIRN